MDVPYPLSSANSPGDEVTVLFSAAWTTDVETIAQMMILTIANFIRTYVIVALSPPEYMMQFYRIGLPLKSLTVKMRSNAASEDYGIFWSVKHSCLHYTAAPYQSLRHLH
jgi:hypothetical protein